MASKEDKTRELAGISISSVLTTPPLTPGHSLGCYWDGVLPNERLRNVFSLPAMFVIYVKECQGLGLNGILGNSFSLDLSQKAEKRWEIHFQNHAGKERQFMGSRS